MNHWICDVRVGSVYVYYGEKPVNCPTSDLGEDDHVAYHRGGRWNKKRKKWTVNPVHVLVARFIAWQLNLRQVEPIDWSHRCGTCGALLETEEEINHDNHR